jgi:hypothetical protein
MKRKSDLERAASAGMLFLYVVVVFATAYMIIWEL